MKIALAQIYSAPDNISANIKKICQLINQAAKESCDLIIFPELAVSGYELKLLPEHVKELKKIKALTTIKETCVENRICCIIGHPVEEYNNIYNCSSYITSELSEKNITYIKSHLIHILEEDQYFSKGESLPVSFPLKGFNAMMSICYDLRFPELFRIPLIRHNYDLIINIAQWPRERIGHFTTLCQARAIENQSYLLSVNGCGQYGETIIGGHSTVYDPFGEILIRCGTYESFKTVTLDSQYINDYRSQFQPIKDIHTKWYQK